MPIMIRPIPRNLRGGICSRKINLDESMTKAKVRMVKG
jgi:hypothetical protein